MPTISAARSCAPAAFRRLCVETADYNKSPGNAHAQPPSGGCVLKLGYELKAMPDGTPAAFRRLCVETMPPAGQVSAAAPAAFRRLCVETRRSSATVCGSCQPPSGGCVLKQIRGFCRYRRRCPAAFRRLCVETCTKYLGS